MHRLRQLMLVLGLAMVGGLTLWASGCTGEGSGSGERTYVTIGTAPVGGVFYTVGGAISDIVNEHGDQGWRSSAESTGGSMENIRLLMADELAFAMSNASITYHAHHRLDEWAEEPGGGETIPVSNVMTLFPNVAMFITPRNSGVEQIADLEGRRVYVGPEGAGFQYFIRPILEAHGLGFDDIRPVYGSQQSAVDYLSDGSVDAAMLGGGVPTASITSAATSMNIRLVPFDDDAKEAIIAEYPFYEPATIPAETYRGQDEDFHGLNVGSAHLITGEQVDDWAVYHLTKVVFENREAIAERHRAGRAINAENVVKDVGVPFHAGAQRYYEEAEIWPADGVD